jgi:hypothetical protein
MNWRGDVDNLADLTHPRVFCDRTYDKYRKNSG